MLVVAEAIVFLVALFFLALGATALVRPAIARTFLLGFANTAVKHYTELLARVLAGGALLIVAQESACSTALSGLGWLLIGTTAVMALVPWRVHDRFARSAVPKALRFLTLIGIGSLLLGALLLWAMGTRSAGEPLVQTETASRLGTNGSVCHHAKPRSGPA